MNALLRPVTSPAELDIEALLRAQRGDEVACRLLITTYERRVAAVLGRILGPRGKQPLVEDLAQETFLRTFRALPTYEARANARLSTWILTIATRLALQELKRAVPPVESLASAGDLAGTSVSPDTRLERAALTSAIRTAVDRLSPQFRAVFVLRAAEGLDYQEIAQMLDIDIGTVRSRLSRARVALREALAEVHDE